MNRLKRERHAAALRPPIAPPHLCTGRQGRRQHHKHNKHTQLKTQTGCENHPQTQVGSRKGGTKPQLTDRAEDNTTNTTKQTHSSKHKQTAKIILERRSQDNTTNTTNTQTGPKTTPQTQQTHTAQNTNRLRKSSAKPKRIEKRRSQATTDTQTGLKTTPQTQQTHTAQNANRLRKSSANPSRHHKHNKCDKHTHLITQCVVVVVVEWWWSWWLVVVVVVVARGRGRGHGGVVVLRMVQRWW